jgi:hypothetical protein
MMAGENETTGGGPELILQKRHDRLGAGSRVF